MIQKIIVLSISLLILKSCNEFKKEPKVFFYENGESSVQLKILNGNNFLIYNTPTRVNFEWKNIDIKTSSIYGLGIKILKASKKVTHTEINVPENYLKNDSLNIKLNFQIKGKNINTEFKVPLRKSN